MVLNYSCCRTSCNRRATTLVEVVVSCLIVGMMLIAAMKSVGAIYKTRLVAVDRQHGEMLAHDLMAEVLQSCYEEPTIDPPRFGLESGETGNGSRAVWDDVDDYDNWSASPPETKDGTPIPNAASWRREVEIERAFRLNPDLPWFTDTGLKRIQVRAISPSGEVFQLRALRSRWGALELKPPVDTTYVTSVSADLQLGAGDTSVGGTAVVNHAHD